MSTKKVSHHKHPGGRPSRGLNVREIFTLSRPLSDALNANVEKYGSKSHIVRLALADFFLREGVSISTGNSEHLPTSTELEAA